MAETVLIHKNIRIMSRIDGVNAKMIVYFN